MKKINIASQIVLLFLVILLISASAFTVITLSRLHAIAEEETFSRLVTYSTLISNHDNASLENENFRDMEVAIIDKKPDIEFRSKDWNVYINQENLDLILHQASQIEGQKYYYTNKIVNHNNEPIYYVYSTFNGGLTYMILMTNSLYVTTLARNVSLQMILIFIVIIFLSILAIAAWSGQFAKRIHRIQDHILSLPREKYENAYIDDGLDEIGELSRAVEEMRIDLNQNEKTKQEMLQNISHDFKTPIAVIKSYAEAQQDGMVDEDSSKIIIAQAEILKRKVNRLLQYNSLEYLSKDLEFEDVDMKEVIEEVIRGYRFQTNLEIELDLTEDIYFKGYRENYSTVVDNIIDNAKRYAKTKIKIVLKKDRLRIYNDGEHIDEQFVNKGFKPYEKGSKGEFGLGVSIVKKTVEFFGMELKVKNEVIGISFIITKPQAKK